MFFSFLTVIFLLSSSFPLFMLFFKICVVILYDEGRSEIHKVHKLIELRIFLVYLNLTLEQIVILQRPWIMIFSFLAI